MITPMILEDYEIADIFDTDLEFGPQEFLKCYPKNTKFIIVKIPKDEADLLKERAVNVRRFYKTRYNISFYGLSLKIRRVSDIEIVTEQGDLISYEDFVRSFVRARAKVIKNTFKVILYERDINEKHVANFILEHARITIKF